MEMNLLQFLLFFSLCFCVIFCRTRKSASSADLIVAGKNTNGKSGVSIFLTKTLVLNILKVYNNESKKTNNDWEEILFLIF